MELLKKNVPSNEKKIASNIEIRMTPKFNVFKGVSEIQASLYCRSPYLLAVELPTVVMQGLK
ncbi:MAG: hypothetical protein WBX01_02010 [Nitrososphaeraceae archaeon]